jgi:glycosyltransferase involved in cell wall biosynthesis
MDTHAKIVVLLPCYNEELTINKVIQDFKRVLPKAEIWVYDNNSQDRSVECAMAAGANVRYVKQQGKGHVVRRMFQEIDADCYVMVDSDDTYPAEEVDALIKPILEGTADMVTGDRLSSTYAKENKRQFHNFGNHLVVALISLLFHRKVDDVMTGYRAFNRLFVKNCPILAQGFEIETEMTLHALAKRMNLVEVPITYRDRPHGSVSKLNTFVDGFKVLRTIFNLFRYYRPFFFFGMISIFMFFISIVMVIPVLSEYFRTGLVPRYPTLIVSGFIALGGLLSFACALILDSIIKYNDQIFELFLKRSAK